MTRVNATLPSLSSQYQIVLAPAQLMNPPRAAGPCCHRTSSGILSRCSTWSTVPAFQSHTTTASPTFSGAIGFARKWCGCVQLDVTIRFSSGFTPTSYMYPGSSGRLGAGSADTKFPCSSSRMSAPRSEEHTSELQSPYDLVCRLLLEKK